MSINPKSLKRNPQAVHQDWMTLEDGRIVTRQGCRILTPARFIERGLAHISEETYIIGYFCVILNSGEYGVSMTCAMMGIDPFDAQREVIEGDEFLVFSFPPGATVVKSNALVKDNTLIGKVEAEMISMGNIPWYYTYRDLTKIFHSAKKHANSNVGENTDAIEMLVSLVARNPQDKTQYYRSTLGARGEGQDKPMAVIALRDVTYAPTNTLSRMAGSYLDVGIIASLNNPTERVEGIERVLRQ